MKDEQRNADGFRRVIRALRKQEENTMKQWEEEYPGKWVYCGKNDGPFGGHFDLEVSKIPNEDYEEGSEEWGPPEIWEGEVSFTVHFTVEAKDEIFNTFEDLKESLSRSLRNLDVDHWDLPKIDDLESPEDVSTP